MTKTRTQLSVLMTFAALVGAAPASFGFGEFERGSLLLDTDVRLTYDSYFIGAHDPSDGDFYASLHPELKYTRKAGLAELSGYVGVDVLRYDTNTRFNAENFSGQFKIELPKSGSRLTGDVTFSYVESDVVDYNVLDRIREKTFSANANFDYSLGLKTSLSEDFELSKVNRDAYSNQTLFSNDLSFRYANFLNDTSLRITENYSRTTSSGDNVLGQDLDQNSNSISAGITRPIFGPLSGEVVYGYRVINRSSRENLYGQNRIAGGFFTLNLHGPFLPPRYFPKIESSASISYEESPSPGINDSGQKTITGNARLSWQARELTKISLQGTRSVGLSATDLSVDTTQVTLSVDETVGYQTTLTGTVGYIWRSFPHSSREDETLEATFNASHHFNKYWSAGFTYQYQDNTTKGDFPANWDQFKTNAHDFSRHLVSVFVSNVF